MSIKRGQVWQLGRHRLMCGDATSPEDVATLMDGKKANLCFTDPPYGMKKENDGVLNDNLNQNKLLEFNRQWIPLSLDALTDIGSWYCWGTDVVLMDIYSNFIRDDKNLTFRNLITWDKGSGQGQNSNLIRSYAVADEKCLFVMKGVQQYSTNQDNYYEKWEPIRAYLDGERQKMGWDIPTVKKIVGHKDLHRDHWFSKSQWSLPTRLVYSKLQQAANGMAFERDYDAIKRDYDANCRSYFDGAHGNFNNVWHFPRANADERYHPTTKPIDLCARAIKSSTRENESVLDLFGGGGSTLIACERLNRSCYMMELAPNWCEVIKDRWENETGETARLLV